MKADDHEIALHDVFGLDIVMTTGEGKLSQKDEKETQVYKRALEKSYSKMKASRRCVLRYLQQISVFSFRSEKSRRFDRKSWFTRMLETRFVVPYPVLYEKSGECVAYVKTTILVMGKGNDRITKAVEMMQQDFSSEKSLQDAELVDLIAQPLKPPAKPRKKK